MLALNLPKTELKIIQKGEKASVFDILRKKYVALTPEEWVRQHFVHYLVEQKGYPLGLLSNEVSLALGDLHKRCDTILYDTHARAKMIIEYKAPTIQITQRVFDQISRYNIAFHVDYLVISNGLQHYCCRMDYEKNSYQFLQDLPCFGEL